MLCCSMRIKPVRGLSSSKTNENTIATVNGKTNIARNNRRPMLYPTTKQVSTEIKINTNQIVPGMRLHTRSIFPRSNRPEYRGIERILD